MYSANMPRLMMRHDPPPSVVAHTPAVETPMRMSRGSRGSTSTELMPGCSPPATPSHCLRSGMRHNGSFSDHDAPPSSERKSPPGIVPAHSVPATPPVSRTQILPSDQGCGSSPEPSGLTGNAGTPRSFQVRPDRKSTRLNSSHVEISYAVFCLKKNKKTTTRLHDYKKQKQQNTKPT